MTTEIQLKPVKWKTGKYNGHFASIGGVQVGGYSWTVKRDDPNKWYATTFAAAGSVGFPTEDEAKAHVEAAVLTFVRRIAMVAGTAPVPT